MQINYMQKLTKEIDMHLIVCGVAVTTAQITDVPEPRHLLHVATLRRYGADCSTLQYVVTVSLNKHQHQSFLLLMKTYCQKIKKHNIFNL